jgi:hypothetical protein
MVPLQWVALPWVSHLTPRRVAPFWLHEASRVPWPLYRQFRLGHYKVHVDNPAHPTYPTMTAWFTMALGDDLDDTLERAAHQAFTEFCERHLPVLIDTAIALLPVWNEGNAVWCECVAVVGDPELPTHHAGWALTARYSQHVSSLLQKVTVTGAHLASAWRSAPAR